MAVAFFSILEKFQFDVTDFHKPNKSENLKKLFHPEKVFFGETFC